MHYNLITILGPTATGKTNLAVYLAKIFNAEIISADSRQVYKFMDIGTGKDLDEYNKHNIEYHLINIAEPEEEYNLYRFKRDFIAAFNSITNRGKLPVLAGGTGLYISSVLQNYKLPKLKEIDDEQNKLGKLSVDELRQVLKSLKSALHNVTDLNDKERLIKAILIAKSDDFESSDKPEINSINIGINPGRKEVRKRINQRLKKRLDEGMIDEVKKLLDMNVPKEKLEFFGLEYRFISRYVNGELNYNDMFQKLNSAINKFAKRQMTWFRKMEKEGVKINWFDGSDYDVVASFIKSELLADE